MKLERNELTLARPTTTVTVDFREKVTQFIGVGQVLPREVSVSDEQLADDGLVWTATLTLDNPTAWVDPRIRGFWDLNWPSLNEIVFGLQKLEEGAKKALKKTAIKSPKGQSALDRYIRRLAKEYKKLGHEPGVSLKEDGKEGPFVRFVQEAARQFDTKQPAGETIAAALRKKGRVVENILLLKDSIQ